MKLAILSAMAAVGISSLSLIVGSTADAISEQAGTYVHYIGLSGLIGLLFICAAVFIVAMKSD